MCLRLHVHGSNSILLIGEYVLGIWLSRSWTYAWSGRGLYTCLRPTQIIHNWYPLTTLLNFMPLLMLTAAGAIARCAVNAMTWVRSSSRYVPYQCRITWSLGPVDRELLPPIFLVLPKWLNLIPTQWVELYIMAQGSISMLSLLNHRYLKIWCWSRNAL